MKDQVYLIKLNKCFNKLAVWMQCLKKSHLSPSRPASPAAAVVNRSGSETKTQMCCAPTETGNEQICPPHLLQTTICVSLSLLLTGFTHHLHLSKKSFEFLQVERRAAVGGAATGSLSKPEHRVKNLGDIDRGTLVNIPTSSTQTQIKKQKYLNGYSRFSAYGCSQSP